MRTRDQKEAEVDTSVVTTVIESSKNNLSFFFYSIYIKNVVKYEVLHPVTAAESL